MKTVTKKILRLLYYLVVSFCLLLFIAFLIEGEFILGIIFLLLCLGMFSVYKAIFNLFKKTIGNKAEKDNSIISLDSENNTSIDDYKKTIIKSYNKTSSESNYEYDFSCIDYETANENMSSACSIGIVSVKDGSIVNEFYSLIKPKDFRVSNANFKIHKISESDLKNEKELPEIWDTISNIIKKSKFMIAHNAQFDMSVLHESTKDYDISIENFKYVDSIRICNPYTDGVSNKLDYIANYFEVDKGNHHNALDDARTTALCVLKSIELSKFSNFNEFINNDTSTVIKEFRNLKSNKRFIQRKFKSVKISDVSANNTEFDQNHPFFGKSVVITGDFEKFSRKEIMQIVLDSGGIVRSAVSRKTDLLIVGNQDNAIVGDDGLSGKQEKAIALIEQGYKIEIIDQEALLSII